MLYILLIVFIRSLFQFPLNSSDEQKILLIEDMVDALKSEYNIAKLKGSHDILSRKNACISLLIGKPIDVPCSHRSQSLYKSILEVTKSNELLPGNIITTSSLFFSLDKFNIMFELLIFEGFKKVETLIKDLIFDK